MCKLNYGLPDFISFKDMDECMRVKAIEKKDIANHPNKNFKIKVIKDDEFIFIKSLEIFKFIKNSAEKEEKLVLIMPNPHPDYRLVANLINRFKVNCKNLYTFNMDEFIDNDGKVAPDTWPKGFNYSFLNNFYYQIDEKLRPPRKQIVGFTDKNMNDYGKLIADMGGADVCFGGIGWAGHIAYIEPGCPEFRCDSMDEFLNMGPRVVTLNPITIAQYCVAPSGDWSSVPPKAITIGPKEIMNSKLFQSWNGHDIPNTNISWQRFIVRLSAHGPITKDIPASILQLRRTEFFIKETIAENV